MIVIGIDLAGSSKRATGFCVMEELKVRTFIVHSDREILKAITQFRPVVVAIDAPLNLPLGRETLRKSKKNAVHFRQCDLELKKLGIKFFPITLGPMRKLTKRGIALKKKIEKQGYDVIEVYPGGAQDLLEIARKPKEKLLSGLKKLGVQGLSIDMTKDELDAVTCAFVARCYVRGCFVALGNPKEGLLIMPKL